MHHGCRRAFFKGSYGALHFRGHEPRNETRLVYKDLNTLALQLPKRKLALSKATQDQRLVWEVLRLLDKAQRSERDANVARALRELREKALDDFTASPHDGKRIFEEIASTVTKTRWPCVPRSRPSARAMARPAAEVEVRVMRTPLTRAITAVAAMAGLAGV